LSAARAVAASVSADSEIGRVVRDSGGGVVTEPEDVEALSAAIKEFFDHPGKRLAMGESGRRYASQHWDENRVLSNLERHLLKTYRATWYHAITQGSTSA
jgi:glycosyltransferase involved in cell wall biosynthesis